MWHYEYSEYSQCNKMLLLVTDGITIGYEPDHSLYFEFSNALEILAPAKNPTVDRSDEFVGSLNSTIELTCH